MKIIRYQISTEINHGTKENPNIEILLQEKIMTWSESGEATAKKEAYNGEITVEDDGQPDHEPTEADQLRADVAELKAALNMILTGVVE